MPNPRSPWLWAALASTAALAALIGVAWRSPLVLINALVPSGTCRLAADLAYGRLPRQRLDVYTPVAAAPAAGWPLVVFFYGGSWNTGERADYKFVAEALAARGVLVLVADYRLYPEVRYPAFLHDSAEALAWGLDHATGLGADPKRVFVMGHSAGAYNAAMLALDPRWLAATGHSPRALAGWIGLAGPYEFLPIVDRDAQPVFFHPDYPPGTQPLDHASAGAPPAFLGAATEDPLVSPQRSTLALAARLRALGVPGTLRMYARVGHATLIGAFAGPLRGLAPVRDDVVAFIAAPGGDDSARPLAAPRPR
jgi:acetyl esterase/lipase